MKIRQIISLFIIIFTFSCGRSQKVIVLDNKKVFFLDARQGYEYLQNSDFVNSLTNLDISLRMKEDYSQKNIEEVKDIYSRFLRNQIKDWNGREETYLVGKLNEIYEHMSRFSPNVIPDSLYLIRSTGDQEFDAFYTVKNAIIFPGFISTSAIIFPWLPYFSNIIKKKLIHESFHIYSTNNKKIRQNLYEIFGFQPIENLILPDVIKQQLITNPDDKGFNYKINLLNTTTGETKNYCLLILSKYPSWVGYKDFSARVNVMLDYLDPRLLEIIKQEDSWIAVVDSTGQPITIPVYDSVELQEKIAVKINAIQSPEEIVAKAYVILIQSLIENEKPENQTSEAIEILHKLRLIINQSAFDN